MTMLSRRTVLAALAGLSSVAVPSASAQPQTAKLLLVHGRGQANLDPQKLKAAWIETLTLGAQALGMHIPENLDVEFPYYGDELQRFVDQANLPLTGEIKAHGGSGQDDDFLAFQSDVAQSIREQTGITDTQVLDEYGNNARPKGPLNWEWVQAILAAIDKHGGGMSQSAIEQFTRDVYLYTRYPAVRSTIDAIVRRALTANKTVVVGHSLGSVVAYSVLHDAGQGINIPLFVTVGSPLGIRAIRDQLAPISYPSGVKDWFNAFDTRDVVALFPLDEQSFPVNPPIRNFPGVRNHTDNRHGIAGYLDNREVARTILMGVGS
ncbi:hypothetical protein [Mesorhizobium sp. M0772]|uniref:hypothetical protein n=1 Tax=Mesorhizobium sp. M0772 TaxID=2956998 RepID=UPI00333A8FCD